MYIVQNRNLYLVFNPDNLLLYFRFSGQSSYVSQFSCVGLHNDVYIKIDIINKNGKSTLFTLLFSMNQCILVALRKAFGVFMRCENMHYSLFSNEYTMNGCSEYLCIHISFPKSTVAMSIRCLSSYGWLGLSLGYTQAHLLASHQLLPFIIPVL